MSGHFVRGRWRAWQGVTGVILSNAATGRVRQFNSSDDATNWLFVNDEKDTARALHGHVKKAGKL